MTTIPRIQEHDSTSTFTGSSLDPTCIIPGQVHVWTCALEVRWMLDPVSYR